VGVMNYVMKSVMRELLPSYLMIYTHNILLQLPYPRFDNLHPVSRNQHRISS